MPTQYIFADRFAEKQKFISMAIEHDLYVKGWMLLVFMEDILKSNVNNYNVSLAVVDDKPVGVSLCLDHIDYGHILFYTDEKYRRQGIATNLYFLMRSGIDKPKGWYYSEPGTKGSGKFFNYIDMVVME